MPQERPNVLLIHTDQQRWDSIGVNDPRDEVQTPNIDEMASCGVNFDRYFVQTPVCMPSRMSYLTGQYSSQLDIYRNGPPLPEDTETIPAMLDNYGYTSSNLGKLHFLPHSNRDHRETHPKYGFDELEISDEPGPYPDAYRAWVKERAPEALDDVSVGLPPAAEDAAEDFGLDDIEHPEERHPMEPRAFPADDDLTHTAFVADRTMDFLSRHADDEPFFAVAGIYSPHSPWVAPQRFLDWYDPDELTLPDFPPELEERRADGAGPDEETIRRARQGYYAMVSEVDHHVGRILDHLEACGVAEDTLVIFTSDHGERLGDFNGWGKLWRPQDAVSRVPFVVDWPGEVADGGRTVSDIVEAVDLVPTILDAAGIQQPPQLLGRSLLPAIRDTDDVGREAALHESPSGKGLRTDRFRYLLQDDGSEELYDLAAPYGEYRDVSEDHPDEVAAMRHRLNQRTLEIDLASTPTRKDLY
jgi:arylsulfatase A-like enzyme